MKSKTRMNQIKQQARQLLVVKNEYIRKDIIESIKVKGMKYRLEELITNPNYRNLKL